MYLVFRVDFRIKCYFYFLLFGFYSRFAIGIVSIQLFGTIGWLVIERPDVKEIHPQPLTAVLTCKVSTFSLIMSLMYNMILILLCTLYAFKTRKIPENFNEAKYIGFTMYSTCIVWLAFLPIYFGTNNDYKVKENQYHLYSTQIKRINQNYFYLIDVFLTGNNTKLKFNSLNKVHHHNKSAINDET